MILSDLLESVNYSNYNPLRIIIGQISSTIESIEEFNNLFKILEGKDILDNDMIEMMIIETIDNMKDKKALSSYELYLNF